jgi:hypothetical protein
MAVRFVRLAETARSPIAIEIDGASVQALHGDTLLVARAFRWDPVSARPWLN